MEIVYGAVEEALDLAGAQESGNLLLRFDTGHGLRRNCFEDGGAGASLMTSILGDRDRVQCDKRSDWNTTKDHLTSKDKAITSYSLKPENGAIGADVKLKLHKTSRVESNAKARARANSIPAKKFIDNDSKNYAHIPHRQHHELPLTIPHTPPLNP